VEGVIIKSTGSWYSVRLRDGEEVKARLPGRFKLENKKNSNPIAVGDKVKLIPESENFVIELILPRKNYIVRKSPKNKYFAHMIAANIDQAILIASYKKPRTSLGFIDRFFVTLEAFRIPGFLLINKSDLYLKEDQADLERIINLYESIGYQTMMTSLLEGIPSEVRDWLQAKTTLLSGHSGSGKSTLINLLQSNAKQQIGEISDFANKGVHTTTFAEMFSLDLYTEVIDTPGIKELGLVEIKREELSHYFPEMRELMGQCKYNNCLHVDEPSCAVRKAVKSKNIALSRFESYLSMIHENDNRR
jgi:ribosome biogenesis GTPase